MIVMKFGGTSVGGPEEINKTYSIIETKLDNNPVVVVSAVSGVTDLLLNLARTRSDDISEIRSRHLDILKKLGINDTEVAPLLDELSEALSGIPESGVTDEILDRIASFGERLSARIIATNLTSRGIKAKAVDAFDIGFVTNDNFVNADILDETYANIRNKLVYKDSVPVVTGFIAKNKQGRITTLGRGGSDYTAAIIGSALKAEEIQIWTDVDGVKSADPRLIPKAETIRTMSFAEASELAYFGAKVLHPKTILPAVCSSIPVKVLNTNAPGNPGTTIIKERMDIVQGRVKAITSKKDIQIITVTSTRMLDAVGFLERLFSVFAKHNIVVDMVSTSEVSVSATTNGSVSTEELINDLGECAHVSVEKDKAIVCVVGEGLNNTPGLAGRLFSCVGRNGINIDMISQGASEINVGLVVDTRQSNDAVKHLHQEFCRNDGSK